LQALNYQNQVRKRIISSENKKKLNKPFPENASLSNLNDVQKTKRPIKSCYTIQIIKKMQ
jgi:hypothetical protein